MRTTRFRMYPTTGFKASFKAVFHIRTHHHQQFVGLLGATGPTSW